MPAPKDPIKYEEYCQKFRDMWKNPEYRQMQVDSHKGQKRSPEAIEKAASKMRGQKRPNYKKGYIKTPEHIAKTKEWRNDKEKVESWRKNREETNLKKYGFKWGKPLTEEERGRISNTLKEGYKSGRIPIPTHLQRADVVEKSRKGVAEAFKNGKITKFINTKPEVETKKIFEKYNIRYQHQKDIVYNFYDFYLPDYNLLIEVDGYYWHSRGIKDKEISNNALKSRRKSDRTKNKLALNRGFRLLRLWEDELYKLENLIKNNFLGLEYLETTKENFNYYLGIA